jgi:hypothetical protein
MPGVVSGAFGTGFPGTMATSRTLGAESGG